jgi:hypothetical protein
MLYASLILSVLVNIVLIMLYVKQSALVKYLLRRYTDKSIALDFLEKRTGQQATTLQSQTD